MSRRPDPRFNRGRIASGPTVPREPTGTLNAVSEVATASFTGTAAAPVASPQLRVQVSAASITLGGTMRAAGTSPPVVTLTAGTGSLTYASGCPGLRVEIDSVAGGTARGQATFRISYNSGSTWAYSGVTTAATYSIPDGPAAGNVVNFPTGTYGTTQSWEATVTTILSTEGSTYTFTNATASRQPIFRDAAVTPDSKDALFCAGAQALVSTDAAAVALFANDPALTVAARVAYTAADANGVYLGAGDSAQATNRQRRFSQGNTGAGRETQVWVNDAGTVVTHTCTTDPLTGGTAAHNVMHYGPGSAGAINIDVNGSTETMSPATATIGTLTPTQLVLGATGNTTPTLFFNGYLYDLAVFSSQLSSADRAAWNTNLSAGT